MKRKVGPIGSADSVSEQAEKPYHNKTHKQNSYGQLELVVVELVGLDDFFIITGIRKILFRFGIEIAELGS